MHAIVACIHTNLDHLLHQDYLQLGLEVPPPSDHSEDDPVYDLTDLPQLLHPLSLQVALKVLTIEHLQVGTTGE